MAAWRQLGAWILSAKRHATTISPDRSSVYSFDLEGRPLSWFENDCTYKRSLASRVHVRDRAGGRRRRWTLTGEQASERFAAVLERTAKTPRAALDEELRTRLEAILGWTPERLLEESRRFEATYEPVSILPPDQYLSVVLQATFGCSWNRCTFCSFYQNRAFRTRTPAEFRAHTEAVNDLLGRARHLRPRIFLADGNALMLSETRLRELMDIACEAFPDRPLAGFIDVFTGEKKLAAGWADLRERGLERVYVGLETGHDPLLAWINKPATTERAREFVFSLKAARVRVSVILMAGLGGRRFAEGHVRDSLDLVSRLPLEDKDIVYLSPFVLDERSAYAQRAVQEHITPLDETELQAQLETLRAGCRAAHPHVRVAPYDIREFIY
ncbi:MAG: radical SAM protein [Acidobacteriota bacterium]|nr:MAG: radical SAM protein [Acidobacteriota bacterium]